MDNNSNAMEVLSPLINVIKDADAKIKKIKILLNLKFNSSFENIKSDNTKGKSLAT
tara:strand:+ start:93 stop:260 length:168 start_codon:yes stop_codon:yes gene_type:complete